MICSKEIEIANRLFKIETGKLANQADSSVTVRYGDTIVLITTCVSTIAKEMGDMVRLTVDYEERHYAVGKIPGSFIRREGRPSETATLTARLTDRSLRPLISKEFPNDIQVVITVLSTDQDNAPDVLALIGASAGLMNSSVPFDGPVGAVHVGYINNEFVINPLTSQMGDSLFDVLVASTKDAVIMLETDAKEASEDLVIKAIKVGHEANQAIIKLQEEFRAECGKPKLAPVCVPLSPEAIEKISLNYGEKLNKALYHAKDERDQLIAVVTKEAVEQLKDTCSETDINRIIDNQLKKFARKKMLETGKHIDGRAKTEIRQLTSEVGLLPRTHGSGLFTRGKTQVLATTTLGSQRQEQLIDGLGLEETKRFIHHYNFPPFSTGEVKRMGSPGRREIGHGALAEKALIPVIPDEKEFSYTIRLVSEVLSSNGSTSMASVCASTLSLMDAGVPIKAPVAGIAMGLVTGEKGEFMVLTDIEGMEDFYGDMDFKVAGTRNGITAIQMDTKTHGLSFPVIEETIHNARDARLFILDNISKAIAASRTELSPYAPRQYKITIDQGKIGALIGPGGKTIRSIIEETKTTIDVDNDGTVIIGSPNDEGAKRAIEIIEGLTKDVEPGAIYTGKVTRLMTFGAFVEILPGKEGLVHISELADYRVPKVEDVVQVGDEITVKVIEIDNQGRINLSRKALLVDSDQSNTGAPQQRPERPASDSRPRHHSGPRQGDRDGGRFNRNR
jgi:polyribonucleotide nucleotidyltransferase